MTTKKKHGHKKSRDNYNRNAENVYRGRIVPSYEERKTTLDISDFTKNPNKIKSERGIGAPSKSETIHANGKTRPIRDEKGHFVGSESIYPREEVKIPVSKRGSFKVKTTNTPQPNKMPSPHINEAALQKQKLFLKISPNILDASSSQVQVDPKPDAQQVKIFRVYSENEIGYRYEISETPPPNRTHVEVAMVLYDPRIDIIALDRAIKKYRMYPE